MDWCSGDVCPRRRSSFPGAVSCAPFSSVRESSCAPEIPTGRLFREDRPRGQTTLPLSDSSIFVFFVKKFLSNSKKLIETSFWGIVFPAMAFLIPLKT